MVNAELAMLQGMGYKINGRTLQSLRPLFSEDYKKEDFAHAEEDVVYSGAEDSEKLKYPNGTHLPHLLLKDGGLVLGQTFGHLHTENDEREFQEIYQFLGHGGLLLQSQRRGRRLYLLCPGDMAMARPDDNMTIYNFGEEPLVTFDFANPKRNKATKELEQEVGSMFIFKTKQAEGNGVRTEVRLNPQYAEKVGIDYKGERVLTVESIGLGVALYDAIMREQDFFYDKEIQVSQRGNVPAYIHAMFKGASLKELVLGRNRCLMDNLWLK